MSEPIVQSEVGAAATTPGFARAVLLAFARLMVWLTALGYIQDAPAQWELALSLLWIGGFCWRYAWRPLHSGNDGATAEWLRPARAHVVQVILLAAVVAASLPWTGGLFTGGCARAEWYDRIWPVEPSIAKTSGWSVFAAALLCARTATFPLIEEFTFRGWLLTAFRARFGPRSAVLVTSTLFAVLHFTAYPGLLVSHFCLAVILALAVFYTGSIWSAVLAHFAYNLSNTLLLYDPLHAALANMFARRVFRCDGALAVTTLSFCLMVLLLIDRRRFHAHPRTD